MEQNQSAEIVPLPPSPIWLARMANIIDEGDAWPVVKSMIAHMEPWQRDRWVTLYNFHIAQVANK